MSSGVGLIAEQDWDFPTSPLAVRDRPDRGLDRLPQRQARRLGLRPAWSAGQFVRLTLDAAAGKVLDRPAYTFNRYVPPRSKARRRSA